MQGVLPMFTRACYYSCQPAWDHYPDSLDSFMWRMRQGWRCLLFLPGTNSLQSWSASSAYYHCVGIGSRTVTSHDVTPFSYEYHSNLTRALLEPTRTRTSSWACQCSCHFQLTARDAKPIPHLLYLFYSTLTLFVNHSQINICHSVTSNRNKEHHFRFLRRIIPSSRRWELTWRQHMSWIHRAIRITFTRPSQAHMTQTRTPIFYQLPMLHPRQTNERV